jgi:hypothetical protein
MLQTLTGLLLLPLLLYGPGAIWSRAIWAAADGLGRHYERAIVSALWTGWLALLLAELGIFTLWLHVGITLLFCAAGWLIGRRLPAVVAPPAARPPRWEAPLYAGALLIFALLVARPFETILGGRDAGVYANTGYAIARTGGIMQTEPLIAEIAQNRLHDYSRIRDAAAQAYTNLLGNQNAERFISTRFTQPGFFTTEEEALKGHIYPQGFHLYPVWIALWTLLFGLHGGLIATGYLGLLGIWSVAMVGRRLIAGRVGAYVGALSLLLLAFNTLQIWFSRYSTAESGTQMLLWAGLAMWASFASLDHPGQRSRAGLWYGALAGLALGQLIMIRLEFFWGVGPVLLYLLFTLVRRRWHRGTSAMALGLGVMLVHGLIHIFTLSRTYFLDNTWGKFQDYAIVSRLAHPFYTPLLQAVRLNNSKTHILTSLPRLLAELSVAVAAVVVLWALWRWPRLLSAVEGQIQRWRGVLLGGAVAGLLVMAGFAYFVRPQHLSLAAVLHPLANRGLWESYIGAPLPIPFDQYPQQAQRAVVLGNLVRLGWYLSPLGILLGVAGLAGWLWRDFNRRSWLVLLVGITYGAFSILDTYGTAEQVYIYIARRFLPGAVPIFTLGTAWLLALLLGSRRRIWRGLGLATTGLLLVFLIATGWRSVRHVEYGGAIEAIAALAERIEPNAIVIMRGGDRDTPTNIATPLRYTFGREVLVAYSPDPLAYREQLAAQVQLWQASGRPVYLLLGSNGGVLNFPGFALVDRGVFDLQLAEWQQLQLQKPYTAGDIRFTYRLYALQQGAAAPATSLNLDLTDYRWQVSGLYPIERDRIDGVIGAPYAWTSGAATLALPATAQTTTLELLLGLGSLPPSLQQQAVEVCPTLRPLAATLAAPVLPCATVSRREPAATRWILPPLPGDSWLFTFTSRTWSPNSYRGEYPTPPNDARTLSIQWSGGRLISTP